jgi:hypothetical protein
MTKHRHAIAATTFAAALFASAFPAHAGLIGGGGGLGIGGSATGSLAGQGSLQTPSPRPLIERTQNKAAAVKADAGAAKDAAAQKAASAAPQAGVSASTDGNASAGKSGANANANGALSGSVQR